MSCDTYIICDPPHLTTATAADVTKEAGLSTNELDLYMSVGVTLILMMDLLRLCLGAAAVFSI